MSAAAEMNGTVVRVRVEINNRARRARRPSPIQ